MSNLKSVIIGISIFVAIIIVGRLLDIIAYTNTTSTCAKITKSVSVRGAWSVVYVYEVNGQKNEGAIYTSLLKDISMDSLQKIECVKIEYSNYSTFFTRIVDKRILKE